MSNYLLDFYSNYQQLTHQQFIEKLKAYRLTNDMLIKEELVLSNMKLVFSLVSKYQHRTNHIEDLQQAGIIGLIKAIDHFNIELDVKFSTYAVPLIIGEIKRYLRDDSSVKIPRSLRDLAYKVLLENEKYMKEENREAHIDELATHLNVSHHLIHQALSSTQSVSSLDQEVQNDGNGKIELIDQIVNQKDEIEEKNKSLDLNNALLKLNSSEKNIIEKRYFLDLTQCEIADELHISQAQVSRIEKKAIDILRKYME